MIINTIIVQEYVHERTTTNGSQNHGLRPNFGGYSPPVHRHGHAFFIYKLQHHWHAYDHHKRRQQPGPSSPFRIGEGGALRSLDLIKRFSAGSGNFILGIRDPHPQSVFS